MSRIQVSIRRLVPTAQLPARKTSGAAGYDLAYAGSVTQLVAPGQRRLLPTGLAMAIPKGYVGVIKDRSGWALSDGVSRRAGVIDSDYRGEVGVLIVNEGDEDVTINPGDRIAQILFCETPDVQLCETDALSDTVRSESGFGSTGKR